MKRIEMIQVEPVDRVLTAFLPEGIPSSDYGRKLINRVESLEVLSVEQFLDYLQILESARDRYLIYAAQDIPVGGIVMTQTAADHLRKNWLNIAKKFTVYLEGEKEELCNAA